MTKNNGTMNLLDVEGPGEIIELTEVVNGPGGAACEKGAGAKISADGRAEKIQIPQEMLEKAVENVIKNIFCKKIDAMLADLLEKSEPA